MEVLLRSIVVVIVVIAVFVGLFLYYTFKIYLAIRLSSRKCVINSVCGCTVVMEQHCKDQSIFFLLLG